MINGLYANIGGVTASVARCFKLLTEPPWQKTKNVKQEPRRPRRKSLRLSRSIQRFTSTSSALKVESDYPFSPP